MAQLLANTTVGGSTPITSLYSETFSTDDSPFALSSLVSSSPEIFVAVGGVLQQAGVDYTLATSNANSVLTLTSSYTENLPVDVRYFIRQETMGQALYLSPGTYSWECPTGVTEVYVVCIGGGGAGQIGRQYLGGDIGTQAAGGGGGGGLGWKLISVSPGSSYTVVVGAGGVGGTSYTQNGGRVNGGSGGTSYFINTSTVRGGGGTGGKISVASGGTYLGDGGGNGGSGYYGGGWDGCGGGGVGGYSGDGGNGGGNTGSNGSGGGGGGGSSDNYYYYGTSESTGGYGGGIDIYGQGDSGTGGETQITDYGASGILYVAEDGGIGSLHPSTTSPSYIRYGRGGGGKTKAYYSSTDTGNPGGDGAVMIRWGGNAIPTLMR